MGSQCRPLLGKWPQLRNRFPGLLRGPLSYISCRKAPARLLYLRPDTLFPAGAGETAYRTLIAANTGSKGANVKTDRYRPTADIVRSLAYVWPWSTHKHLGINSVPPPGTAVGSYYDVHLYASPGVFDDSWRRLRAPLIHEAIKQIEQTNGVMRGHTIGEFRASPEYRVQKYYCDTCGTDQLLVELTAVGGSGVGKIAESQFALVISSPEHTAGIAATMLRALVPLVGKPIISPASHVHAAARGSLRVQSQAFGITKFLFSTVTTTYVCGTCGQTRGITEPSNNTGTHVGQVCNAPCPGTFQGIRPARVNEIGEQTDMMGLPAAGESMGGLWLFCTYGRGVSTWAHEIAHHKHLEHGPGGGGYVNAQHDSVTSTLAPLNGFAAPRNQWDRVCMMGYVRTGANAADVDRGYFCGKCILKLRGWVVQTGGVHNNRPAGGVAGP